MKKTFEFHWLTGQIERGKGDNVADTFANLGYGGGAIRALDYYEEIKEDNMPLGDLGLSPGEGKSILE